MVWADRLGELAEVDCGALALLVSFRPLQEEGKVLGMPLMLLSIACSHGINALSDSAVYSLTYCSLWNAKQNAADSIA